MGTEKQHYVELWTKQSQLFWQTVYQVPIIAGAMFAGWFALKSASQDLLAQVLLLVGFLSMTVQILILKRMSQYMNTFRQAADRLIPSVPAAFGSLTGYILGIAVPALIGLFFIVLLIWSPDFAKSSTQSSAKTDTNLPQTTFAAVPVAGKLPSNALLATTDHSPAPNNSLAVSPASTP